MKIALCFSGEPRYCHLASKSLMAARKFCEENNIVLHVFCHFWTDITKRKHVYDKDDYIVTQVDIDDIIRTFDPTAAIIENKDALDSYAEFTYNYIQELIKPIGTPTNNLAVKQKEGTLYRDTWYMCKDLDRLKHQIKYTNTPPISQLFSICKSHDIRIQYEKEHNIQYDLVVRLRSDVSFKLPSIEKLTNIVKKNNTTVYFPQVWSTLQKNEGEDNIGLGVEYAMFVGSSKILDDQLFDNYRVDILKNLFKLKHNGVLFFVTSHNFFPNLIMNTTNDITHIRNGTLGFTYTLEQMELFR